MGSSVPLRLLLGEDGRVEGQHVISVFGQSNVAVTVPVPEYKVKDCQPERVVMVESRVQPNTWGDFDFVAKVVALPRRPREFAARDRTGPSLPSRTRGPSATVMPLRRRGPPYRTTTRGGPQDSLYSYFAVRVDVRDAGGEILTGRTTLPLINQAFEAFARKGIVQLLIALDPRFPDLGPDGRVVQNVRLWHTRAEPVTIDAAAVTRYFEGASGETQPQPIDVAALLGTTTVPPGKDGLTTSVVLDTITDPGVFSMTYRLSGHSPDGHPVMGSFSVMRPPPRPTADNSQAVVDPTLKAKIVAAREILGKDTVNDEDLWQLERQGRFADITPASDAPAGEPARPGADGFATALPCPGPPCRRADLRYPRARRPPPRSPRPETPTASGHEVAAARRRGRARIGGHARRARRVYSRARDARIRLRLRNRRLWIRGQRLGAAPLGEGVLRRRPRDGQALANGGLSGDQLEPAASRCGSRARASTASCS